MLATEAFLDAIEDHSAYLIRQPSCRRRGIRVTSCLPARFRREVTPPGRWWEALIARFAAAHAYRGHSGLSNLLQTVLLLRESPDVIVPARPPRSIQRVLFPALAAVVRAIGRTAHYPYPEDDVAQEEVRRF